MKEKLNREIETLIYVYETMGKRNFIDMARDFTAGPIQGFKGAHRLLGNRLGDTFHNQWQSFRVKKNPKVDYRARHAYNESGEYQAMVKVVSIFGNDYK